MNAFEAFMCGVGVACVVTHLFGRVTERLHQQQVRLLEQKACLLQRRLDREQEGGHVRNELNASRVELAFNFAAMRWAACDEERT